MNDIPLQRQIKIGRATVGLVGLDTALGQAINSGIERSAAIEQVYDIIARHNYIPTGMRDDYRQAICREYDRLTGGKNDKTDDTLTIRILGPGCVSCNNIQQLVFEIMNEMQVKADIFQIHDLDEIGRFGVMQTPALIINGKLKSAGRLPSRSKIEEWLKEEI